MNGRILRFSLLFLPGFFCFISPAAGVIYEPGVVATIIIDGIDSAGPTAAGTVGEDEPHSLIPEIATLLGASVGSTNPTAPNQVTMTRHYGNQYPAYYSAADRSEVDQLTTIYGGGIPRYAAIIAKFCRQVLKRSGARQVNVVGLSMGAYIGRWMIENDYEQLASQGKIARFITVEGVVCGNWACSAGGAALSLIQGTYNLNTNDLEQMDYDWFEMHLHNPRTEMDNAFYANIQVMHWASTDDNENQRALTLASGRANDGVQLWEDAFFHTATSTSKYNNQPPTLSQIDATHNTAKDHLGIRAGLVADLTSTRRVRITLLEATVKNMPEAGEGEVVFGCRILSPQAQARFGITQPINQIDNQGHTLTPVKMHQGQRVTPNQILFDDFVLPGEQALTIQFDLREIDYDPFYGIYENPLGDATQAIGSKDLSVSTLVSADYANDNTDWYGLVRVETIPYPAFAVNTGAGRWSLYP